MALLKFDSPWFCVHFVSSFTTSFFYFYLSKRVESELLLLPESFFLFTQVSVLLNKYIIWVVLLLLVVANVQKNTKGVWLCYKYPVCTNGMDPVICTEKQKCLETFQTALLKQKREKINAGLTIFISGHGWTLEPPEEQKLSDPPSSSSLNTGKILRERGVSTVIWPSDFWRSGLSASLCSCIRFFSNTRYLRRWFPGHQKNSSCIFMAMAELLA